MSYQEVVHELITAYDSEMGIDSGHSGVEMSAKEDPLQGSLYDSWFRVYKDERIYQATGLDFDKFLDRPRYKIDIILKRVREDNLKEGRLAEAALADATAGQLGK